MIGVAVIDDHPVVRAGLAQVVSDASGLELRAAAESVEAYLRADPADVDVVVLDLGLPGISGPAAVRAIVDRGTAVLVVSADASPRAVVDAMSAGASGYLTKSAPAYDIVVALREIAQGRTYVSPTLAGYLLRARRDADPWLTLTDRQWEVLDLLAEGMTDAEIAQALDLALGTVRGHLDEIRNRLQIRRRQQLAVEYVRRRGRPQP